MVALCILGGDGGWTVDRIKSSHTVKSLRIHSDPTARETCYSPVMSPYRLSQSIHPGNAIYNFPVGGFTSPLGLLSGCCPCTASEPFSESPKVLGGFQLCGGRDISPSRRKGAYGLVTKRCATQYPHDARRDWNSEIKGAFQFRGKAERAYSSNCFFSSSGRLTKLVAAATDRSFDLACLPFHRLIWRLRRQGCCVFFLSRETSHCKYHNNFDSNIHHQHPQPKISSERARAA
jgi:hypothetical protein